MSRFNTGVILVILLAGAVVALVVFISLPRHDNQLRLLAWVGYEEEDFIHRFEEEFEIDAHVKTYVGGDQMYSLFTQDPLSYDVVVMDPEYIVKLQREGLLQPLEDDIIETKDYFTEFQRFEPAVIDGKPYGVVIRFGTCGLVYNTRHISPADADSYDILFEPRVKQRVGIWDWYLPSMGCISRSLGNTDPYEIDNPALGRVRERLAELRGQVAAIYSTPAAISQGLRNEDVWIVPAVGEWIAVGLAAQGVPVEWSVPREGGIMWVETLGIPVDAANMDAARKFVRWAQRPTVQADLMRRRAYQSQAPCPLSYNSLSPEERRVRKAHSTEMVERLVSRLSVRQLPTAPGEASWQEVWEEFKSQTP